MELASINLGRARLMEDGKGPRTGIYKAPAAGSIVVTELGLEGDAICSKKHHGGPDQALYLYGLPDYEWWSDLLGRELEPGTFAENLTIAGLESASIRVGDRFHVGPVLLESTGPRVPCSTLARRMGDPSFVRRFRDAERPGVYCRVITPGALQVGTPVVFEPTGGETVSNLEVYRDFFSPDLNETAIRRFLAAPIAERARAHKEKQLRAFIK